MPCIRYTPNQWPVGIVSIMDDLSFSSITKMEQEWHVLLAAYLMATAIFGATLLLSTEKKMHDHEKS